MLTQAVQGPSKAFGGRLTSLRMTLGRKFRQGNAFATSPQAHVRAQNTRRWGRFATWERFAMLGRSSTVVPRVGTLSANRSAWIAGLHSKYR